VPAGPGDDTLDTLASVVRYTDPSRVIVVVDDGSGLAGQGGRIRDLSGDIAVIPALTGLPYEHFWMLGISRAGRPGRKFFDQIVRVDWPGGAVDTLDSDSPAAAVDHDAALDLRAAVAALRKMQPRSIVVAVPVAAAQTCEEFRVEGIDLVCLRTPEPFQAVGLWYDDFSQTTDDEVREILSHERHPEDTDATPRRTG